MTDLLSDFWVHDVSVERYTGSGASGDTYATAATVTGFIDSAALRGGAGQRLIGGDGQEVVASMVIYFPAGTASIPPGSRVTLPAMFGSHPRIVIASMRRDGGPLDVPEHLEVALQ